jgi:hypothetical protein
MSMISIELERGACSQEIAGNQWAKTRFFGSNDNLSGPREAFPACESDVRLPFRD